MIFFLCRLEKAGFPIHLLPEIRPAGSVVGKLAFDWEGIPYGADVFVALGDLQSSVYPFLEEAGSAGLLLLVLVILLLLCPSH